MRGPSAPTLTFPLESRSKNVTPLTTLTTTRGGLTTDGTAASSSATLHHPRGDDGALLENSATAAVARAAIFRAFTPGYGSGGHGRVDDQGAVAAPTFVSVSDRTALYQNRRGLGRKRCAFTEVRPSRLNPGKFEARIWKLEDPGAAKKEETETHLHALLLRKKRKKQPRGPLATVDADADADAATAERVTLRPHLTAVGSNYKNERAAKRAVAAALKARDATPPDPALGELTSPPAPLRLHIVVAWEGFNGLSVSFFPMIRMILYD